MLSTPVTKTLSEKAKGRLIADYNQYDEKYHELKDAGKEIVDKIKNKELFALNKKKLFL